jgi:pimeloyl-ACP methyl ester carboxylesterase
MARYVEHDGGRIAYDVTGPERGELIICGPGMGDVRAMYRLLTPLLTEAGYRVATMDLRGHGESSTGWNDYSSAAIGTDFVALAKHLGGPATLIGDSYCAAAAVVAAADQPDLVKAIVLAGPFVRSMPAGFLAKLAVGLVARSRGLWVSYYKSLYKSGKPADFAEYTRALSANLKEPGRFAAFAAMTKGRHDVSEAKLPGVRCPALVLMGEKDPDFPDPAAEAAWIAKALTATSATVKVLPGCGHYPPAEQPAQTAEAVLAFLANA